MSWNATVRKALREKLLKRDGSKCCWCGRECDITAPLNSDAYPTLEHVVRQADGGRNTLNNLKIACRRCNCTRHAGVWTKT